MEKTHRAKKIKWCNVLSENYDNLDLTEYFNRIWIQDHATCKWAKKGYTSNVFILCFIIFSMCSLSFLTIICCDSQCLMNFRDKRPFLLYKLTNFITFHFFKIILEFRSLEFSLLKFCGKKQHHDFLVKQSFFRHGRGDHFSWLLWEVICSIKFFCIFKRFILKFLFWKRAWLHRKKCSESINCTKDWWQVV